MSRSEPCLCGAEDCRECYPQNFDLNGRYIDPEGDDDGEADTFDPPDPDDDWYDDPRADYIAGNGINDY